jgi:hypothetical protein
MRSRLLLTALFMVTAASPPALAQEPRQKGGIPTETQRRLAKQNPLPWDLLGLFGLFGLLGLGRRHPDDSYHPSPLE